LEGEGRHIGKDLWEGQSERMTEEIVAVGGLKESSEESDSRCCIQKKKGKFQDLFLWILDR